MPKYRFHDNEPDGKMPTPKLQVRTRKNLEQLEQLFGMKFEDTALTWNVFQPGFAHIGVRERTAKDILIKGTRGTKTVEYWRHETEGYASGQTLVYVDGKRYRVNLLLDGEEKLAEETQ